MSGIGLAMSSAAIAASFVCGMMVQAARSSQAEAKKDVRVTGIGGVFFKAKDSEKLAAWYREHLGIEFQSYGGSAFHQFEWLEKIIHRKRAGLLWRFSRRRRRISEKASRHG